MAATGDAEREVARHPDTYSFFTGLMKWATLVAVVAAFIVIFIIAN
jgi:hypothetical protein